jgi:hypothetical protein
MSLLLVGYAPATLDCSETSNVPDFTRSPAAGIAGPNHKTDGYLKNLLKASRDADCPKCGTDGPWNVEMLFAA